MMLKLCVIDPPSVEVIVSMLKALNNDKEFNINGIEISIFHTKEVPTSWIEIDIDINVFRRRLSARYLHQAFGNLFDLFI